MTRRRARTLAARARIVVVVFAAALIAAVGPFGARANADIVALGQAGNNSDANIGSDCNAFSFGDSGTMPYSFPFSGVLTSFRIRVGPSPTDAETAVLRTFRPTGAPSAGLLPVTTMSEGGAQTVNAAAGSWQTFYDRVPATAGDKLGVEIKSGLGAGDTQCRFSTSNAADVVAFRQSAAPPATDNTFATVGSLRPNVAAVLESDADGDGYGDETQDLCPGDAAAYAAPCHGSLMGSGLASPPAAPFNGCIGYTCIMLQRTVAGSPTAAPFDGVIVRWRVRPAVTVTTRLRVLHPDGVYNFDVARSSDPVTLSPSPVGDGVIRSIPARIPIAAGDYIGLQKPFGVQLGTTTTLGGSTVGYLNDAPDGQAATQTLVLPVGYELAYDADVERDADHDGYGDATQDACPSDNAEQGDCPKPVIGRFSITPRRFCVNRKGPVISRCPRGSTVNMTLSKPSAIRYVIRRNTTGRRKGGKCVRRGAATRRAARCSYLERVMSFDRKAVAGVDAFPFNPVRIVGHKTKPLAPGSYTLTATPTSIASNVTGDEKAIAFRIARH